VPEANLMPNHRSNQENSECLHYLIIGQSRNPRPGAGCWEVASSPVVGAYGPEWAVACGVRLLVANIFNSCIAPMNPHQHTTLVSYNFYTGGC
jgi:hypothetical protein